MWCVQSLSLLSVIWYQVALCSMEPDLREVPRSMVAGSTSGDFLLGISLEPPPPPPPISNIMKMSDLFIPAHGI